MCTASEIGGKSYLNATSQRQISCDIAMHAEQHTAGMVMYVKEVMTTLAETKR
jgi:hypothetical protein